MFIATFLLKYTLTKVSCRPTIDYNSLSISYVVVTLTNVFALLQKKKIRHIQLDVG
jgi:hypothetical protein